MEKKKLLDQVADSLRQRRCSKSTISAYTKWIKAYIIFHNKKHPSELNNEHVRLFIQHLVIDLKLSDSTQKQAFCSIIYLYKMLGIKLNHVEKIEQPKRSKRIPAVFAHEEAVRVISNMRGETKLMAQIMYGSGLRLNEVCKLRIKDIDFGNNCIIVHEGKGNKDRSALLPSSIIPDLKLQIQQAQIIYSKNALNKNYNGVFLPDSVENKYPSAAFEFKWFYLFPARQLVKKIDKQYHLHDSLLQKQVKYAVLKAGVNKFASCHTFRHSFATELIKSHVDIRTVQELLGHANIKTTQVYLHIIPNDFNYAVSPLDKQNDSFNVLRLVNG